MYLRRSWAVVTAAVAVAALLALGPPARADFVVTITDYDSSNNVVGSETITQNYGAGTTTITFTGSAASLYSSGTTGTAATGTLGNGSVNIDYTDSTGSHIVTGGASAPPATGATSGVGSVDTTQSTVNVNIGAGHTLVITEAVNNLGPLLGPLGSITSTLANSKISGTGSQDSLQSFYDAGNGTTAGVGTNYTGTQGPLTTLSGSATATAVFSGTSPFAISNVLTFNAGSDASALSATGTTLVNALPEPASMALWLSGLPVLGLARFWRRRQQRGPLAIA